MNSIDLPPETVSKVFISYSHNDRSHLARLKVHLEPYRRVGMDAWDDTRLDIGQIWRSEIERALAATKVAILLVSADFLASRFIAENELPPLLEAARSKGVVVLPVVVGACNFTATPLAQFQAANEPSKPLNSIPRSKRDEIWSRVAAAASSLSMATVDFMHPLGSTDELPVTTGVGLDSVLGDEIDTLIALQETLRNAPTHTHFPYLVRPVGPLFATTEAKLRTAQSIRRRILSTVIQEADSELAAGDDSSDRYHGYVAHLAYLRTLFDADDWLRFEGIRDTTEVMLEIAPELMQVLPIMPKTEVECYQQEQIAAAHLRYDMTQLGTKTVSAFRAGKEEIFHR